MQEKEKGKVISKKGDVNWLLTSDDMILLDIFYLGLQGRSIKVIQNQLLSKKDEIVRIIDKIDSQLWEKNVGKFQFIGFSYCSEWTHALFWWNKFIFAK